MGKVINMPKAIRPDENNIVWSMIIKPDNKGQTPLVDTKSFVIPGFNGWMVSILCSSYDEMIQCRTQALEQLKNQIHITGLVQKEGGYCDETKNVRS